MASGGDGASGDIMTGSGEGVIREPVAAGAAETVLDVA